MRERIDSLERAIQFGLAAGKRNLIVDLDLLAALLSPDAGLNHADLCRLARLFGDGCNLRLEHDQRINEWLKDRLAEAARRHLFEDLAASGDIVDAP